VQAVTDDGRYSIATSRRPVACRQVSLQYDIRCTRLFRSHESCGAPVSNQTPLPTSWSGQVMRGPHAGFMYTYMDTAAIDKEMSLIRAPVLPCCHAQRHVAISRGSVILTTRDLPARSSLKTTCCCNRIPAFAIHCSRPRPSFNTHWRLWLDKGRLISADEPDASGERMATLVGLLVLSNLFIHIIPGGQTLNLCAVRWYDSALRCFSAEG
jgi:hypothetical protein